MQKRKIAALFVENPGVYSTLSVEIWDIKADARTYAGPHPVVAHPPCKRWGRYWSGGPSAKVRRKLGDDDGCFAAAWDSVRRFGGVLEHPEASHAWRIFGIPAPPKAGGWIPVPRGGWTCCVEQGHYGHAARKATWLYATGPRPQALIWGPSSGRRLEPGFHSKEERRLATDEQRLEERLSRAERVGTPLAFAELLLDIARASTPAY